MIKRKLYLIPTFISEDKLTIPAYVLEKTCELNCFIVENVNSAVKFLKKAGHRKIQDITFFQTGKDDSETINFLLEGNDVGILSEAGMPCIADPGSDIVLLAHEYEIPVIPFAGPSSIIMSLCASGLNGQNFAFNGYLSIKEPGRNNKLKECVQKIMKENQTQIFIESPHRNNELFETLLKKIHPKIFLCVACNLTSEKEFIATKTIEEWIAQKITFKKFPVVFLLGKGN